MPRLPIAILKDAKEKVDAPIWSVLKWLLLPLSKDILWTYERGHCERSEACLPAGRQSNPSDCFGANAPRNDTETNNETI